MVPHTAGLASQKSSIAPASSKHAHAKGTAAATAHPPRRPPRAYHSSQNSDGACTSASIPLGTVQRPRRVAAAVRCNHTARLLDSRIVLPKLTCQSEGKSTCYDSSASALPGHCPRSCSYTTPGVQRACAGLQKFARFVSYSKW